MPTAVGSSGGWMTHVTLPLCADKVGMASSWKPSVQYASSPMPVMGLMVSSVGSGGGRVAQIQYAGIEEQAAIAVFGKAGELVCAGNGDAGGFERLE